MKRALNTLIHVIAVITCFDVIVWIGDLYWRKIGEREMKKAHAEERVEHYTKEILNIWSKSVSAYIRKNKTSPRSLLEAKSENFGRTTDYWDNELRLEKEGGKVFIVSAGPDGEFETEDDLKCEAGKTISAED